MPDIECTVTDLHSRAHSVGVYTLAYRIIQYDTLKDIFNVLDVVTYI